MAQKNLFKTAATSATKKVVNKHQIVAIDNKFAKDLARISDIDATIAELEAERKGLDSDVREEAKSSMLTEYDNSKKFPGTLQIEAGNMTFQFITMDKYLKIDVDRSAELSAKYGEEVVEEKTTYKFNNEMLEKYNEEISEALLGSNKIADEDKEKLIESETAYGVAKGVVKELREPRLAKHDINELVADLAPIFAIKGIKKAE